MVRYPGSAQPVRRTPGEQHAQLEGHHAALFHGQGFGGYDQIMYEQYDAATGKTTHPKVNLRKLISDYDLQAAGILSAVLVDLKRKCP